MTNHTKASLGDLSCYHACGYVFTRAITSLPGRHGKQTRAFHKQQEALTMKVTFLGGLLSSTQAHVHTQKSCFISPLIPQMNTVQGTTHAKPPTVVMCTIYFDLTAALLHTWIYQ